MCNKLQTSCKGLFRLILSFLLTSFFTHVIAQTPVLVSDSFQFSHTSSLLLLKSGTILPNLDTLKSDKILLAAFGGSFEGSKDCMLWLKSSDSSGQNWSNHNFLNTNLEVSLGDSLSRDPLLFKTQNNTLVLLFRVQIGEGNAISSGQLIPFYKKSYDGGISWTKATPIEYNQLPLDTIKRYNTSINPPVQKGDSLYFPFYYRNLGQNKTYFSLMVSDLNFSKFHARYYPELSPSNANLVLINENTISLYGNKMIVHFRTNHGNIYKSESLDGLVWSSLSPTDMINPQAKFQISNIGENIITAINHSTLSRDNLSLFNSLGKSYFIVDNIKNQSEIQVSYPSFVLDENFAYISYSKQTGPPTIQKKSVILFKKIPLNLFQTDTAIFKDWEVIDSIEKTNTIKNSITTDNFTYLLSKKGAIYELNNKTLGKRYFEIEPFSFMDKYLNLAVLDSVIYAVGPTLWFYRKLDLKTLVFSNSIIPISGANKVIAWNGDLLVENQSRNKVFIVDPKLDQVKDTINIPSGSIKYWNQKNGYIFVLTDSNYLLCIHLSNKSIKTSKKLTGYPVFFSASDTSVAIYSNGNINTYLFSNANNIASKPFPLNYGPKDFISYEKMGQNIISDGYNVYDYTLPNNIGTILNQFKHFEIMAIIRDEESIKFVTSNGNILQNNKATGIKTNSIGPKHSFRIYPNPFIDKINFETNFSDAFEIEIFDAMGYSVSKTSYVNSGQKISIDLSGFKDGLYFAIISTYNKKYIQKIIKSSF